MEDFQQSYDVLKWVYTTPNLFYPEAAGRHDKP
jgi:hypothetical protein